MDRSRLLAAAAGIIAVGIAGTPAVAAGHTDTTPRPSHSITTPAERSAAAGDLSVNDFPCCV